MTKVSPYPGVIKIEFATYEEANEWAKNKDMVCNYENFVNFTKVTVIFNNKKEGFGYIPFIMAPKLTEFVNIGGFITLCKQLDGNIDKSLANFVDNYNYFVKQMKKINQE